MNNYQIIRQHTPTRSSIVGVKVATSEEDALKKYAADVMQTNPTVRTGNVKKTAGVWRLVLSTDSQHRFYLVKKV